MAIDIIFRLFGCIGWYWMVLDRLMAISEPIDCWESLEALRVFSRLLGGGHCFSPKTHTLRIIFRVSELQKT